MIGARTIIVFQPWQLILGIGERGWGGEGVTHIEQAASDKQVYYSSIFFKIHKHVQWILNQKVFRKVIKNAQVGYLGGKDLKVKLKEGVNHVGLE